MQTKTVNGITYKLIGNSWQPIGGEGMVSLNSLGPDPRALNRLTGSGDSYVIGSDGKFDFPSNQVNPSGQQVHAYDGPNEAFSGKHYTVSPEGNPIWTDQWGSNLTGIEKTGAQHLADTQSRAYKATQDASIASQSAGVNPNIMVGTQGIDSASQTAADMGVQSGGLLQDTNASSVKQGGANVGGIISSAGAIASSIASGMSSGSVGGQTTEGAVNMGVQGASLGFMVGGPVGAVAGGAIGAVMGGIMGSRKAKKAEAARRRAEKKKREAEKRARTERVYTAKMSQDTAAYTNLQNAVSSALRRDNQIQIRT